MPGDPIDLLIVGAGPAGLLASAIASSIGLSHLVVERREGTHLHPSAHVIKTHSMEVYRRIGIADAIDAVATSVKHQRYVTWCENASGFVYGRIDLKGRKGPAPRFASISPAHTANIPQSVLEPILLDRARAMASDDPVHFGAALKNYVQDATGVTATVQGEGGERQIRCRYLIGADGAGSRVRRIAGIGMHGPPVIADFVAINIKSDVRDILERNPGVLFFVRQPGLDGTFIMHQAVGQQVFMMRFNPDATPFTSFDDARCAAIVSQAFGCEHEFEITGVGQWAMSAQVAERYRERRVFIVGDAAHRFPPTGGLGLNTGVEDVENLMWKLGAVLRGQAGDGLLDSYEEECRPIALRNTAQSVENNARIAEVERALGADAGDAAFTAALRGMRDGDAEDRLTRTQKAIDDQLKHFSHLELEMAATINTGALIPPERDVRRPVPEVEDFQPSFRPGGSMPHFWLLAGTSTLDVLRYDRFTLFTPSVDVGEWREAAEALGESAMPVEVVPLESDTRNGQATVAEFWGEEPYAVLVRPDGRIAWIEPVTVGDRGAALADALAVVARRSAQVLDAAAA